jgi:hypothetical protein
VNVLIRIGLWFGCLLVAVAIFSLFFVRLFSIGSDVIAIFRITMMFALPVWFLYVPFIVVLKDAEDRRIWIILVSGILIGPLALILWSFILQLRGSNANTDPLAGSTAGYMIFSSVVGLLAAAIYGFFLKAIYRLTRATRADTLDR